MNRYRGIAITDGKNRYDEVFPFKTMIMAYNESDPIGLPSNYNHDSTRMAGWSFLTGIFIEPGKAYLTNELLIPENKEDQEKLNKRLIYHANRRYIDEHEKEIEELKSLLGDNLSEKALVAPINGVAIYDEGILYKLFPDLEPKDKKGLVGLNELTPVGPGIFRRDKFIIFAHTYFRRNCALVNSLNTHFLSLLQSIDNPNLKVKIKLDPDLIGLYGTTSETREYQYWWGPMFNDDLTRIELGVARFKNEAYDNISTNIDFTEFGWYEQDGHKTLECEEVQDRENIFEDVSYYGCRYIHSYLNSETGLPTHLDGAIRAYTEEQIVERIDTKIDKCERTTFYTKLWRIDGDMPIELWKNLITQFYRDNRQVGEYLGGKDETYDQIIANKKKEDDKNPLKDYIPINFNEGDGIRCFYSRRLPLKIESCDIQATSQERVLLADGEYLKVTELETITILKRMKVLGYSVSIPQTYLTQHEDMITNLPVFCCVNPLVAVAVIKVINEFCEIWISNGDDRILSFSVDFNINDSGVHLSFVGHIKDIHTCIIKTGTSLLESGDYNSWLLKLYEVNNNYERADQRPKLYELLTQSYELYIPRKVVPLDIMGQILNGDGTVALDEAEYNLMKENGIDIAAAYVFEEAICEKCRKNYCSCKCIKFIDDVGTEIAKLKTSGMVWTNRHA